MVAPTLHYHMIYYVFTNYNLIIILLSFTVVLLKFYCSEVMVIVTHRVSLSVIFSVTSPMERGHCSGEFSVPQIEYPLRGSTKKGSHGYFLLQDFWVMLLFHQIILLSDINVVLMSK